MSRLIFGQQDSLSNPTNPANDLVILNDSNFSNSGISIGPGGIFENMRMSYSIPDSMGKIATDNLKLQTSNLYMQGLGDATAASKNFRYMVLDPLTGKVNQGFSHYKGDLNTDLTVVKNDILLLKQAAGLPVIVPADYSKYVSYASFGLNIIVIIVIIILFVKLLNLHKKVDKQNASSPNSYNQAYGGPQGGYGGPQGGYGGPQGGYGGPQGGYSGPQGGYSGPQGGYGDNQGGYGGNQGGYGGNQGGYGGNQGGYGGNQGGDNQGYSGRKF